MQQDVLRACMLTAVVCCVGKGHHFMAGNLDIYVVQVQIWRPVLGQATGAHHRLGGHGQSDSAILGTCGEPGDRTG
jgi:hypothetical protein